MQQGASRRRNDTDYEGRLEQHHGVLICERQPAHDGAAVGDPAAAVQQVSDAQIEQQRTKEVVECKHFEMRAELPDCGRKGKHPCSKHASIARGGVRRRRHGKKRCTRRAKDTLQEGEFGRWTPSMQRAASRRGSEPGAAEHREQWIAWRVRNATSARLGRNVRQDPRGGQGGGACSSPLP